MHACGVHTLILVCLVNREINKKQEMHHINVLKEMQGGKEMWRAQWTVDPDRNTTATDKVNRNTATVGKVAKRSRKHKRGSVKTLRDHSITTHGSMEVKHTHIKATQTIGTNPLVSASCCFCAAFILLCTTGL
jgi:hypothetical protein